MIIFQAYTLDDDAWTNMDNIEEMDKEDIIRLFNTLESEDSTAYLLRELINRALEL